VAIGHEIVTSFEIETKMKTCKLRVKHSALLIIGTGIICLLPTAKGWAAADRPSAVSMADYTSLQAAIDKNPGGTIIVPPGDHSISDSLIIRHDGTALTGFGRILQTNSKAAIVRIDQANNVVLRDLTLARAPDSDDTVEAGVVAEHSDNVNLEGIRVIDNHSYAGSIRLRNCSNGRIENCIIQNYKRVGIDDRTRSPELGYAFQCIDGTGIKVGDCLGTMILNNQIIERRLLPTREIMDKYHLGKLIEGKLPTKFGPLGLWIEKLGFAKHWHQGSAILVSGPEKTTFTRVSGNYIENAAQGMDIHSDNFICTENIVNRGMMGMKAMHGSRNGIIARNIFSHVDNWGIMLGPGTASHSAEAASEGKPAREANSDGTIIIANNVISDFGRGLEFWNWGGDGPDAASSAVFRFERGQMSSNPPLSNVLVEGNILTNSEPELRANGEAIHPKPRYNYAILIETQSANGSEHNYPVNIRVLNNLFEPGQKGLCNVPIPSSN
jgi:hypothetical protein